MLEHALYVVATPIGNLSDISQRALDVLNHVDLIAAEDTRHSKRLLQQYSIRTPSLSLHEHNEQAQTTGIIDRLLKGDSIALISDSGTPLISDPGYKLVVNVIKSGIKVVPIPGPCALIAAISVSGLPTDQFTFVGFLPAKSEARRKALTELVHERRTIVFYESPHRIIDCLKAMVEILGKSRYGVIARELTKKFETVHGDFLVNLVEWIKSDENQQKGEFVVLVSGQTVAESNDVVTCEINVEDLMRELLAQMPVKQAVTVASNLTKQKRNHLYQLALNLHNKN